MIFNEFYFASNVYGTTRYYGPNPDLHECDKNGIMPSHVNPKPSRNDVPDHVQKFATHL